VVSRRLSQLATTLQEQFGSARQSRGFSYSDMPQPVILANISPVAKQFGYEANPNEWNRVAFVMLRWTEDTTLCGSMHGRGPRYRGVIGALMLVNRGVSIAVPENHFQMNYRDTHASERCAEWLERGLTQALAMWRNTL